MATDSGILAWKNHMDRGAWRATVRGVTKELDTTEHTLGLASLRSLFTYLAKTPVFSKCIRKGLQF